MHAVRPSDADGWRFGRQSGGSVSRNTQTVVAVARLIGLSRRKNRLSAAVDIRRAGENLNVFRGGGLGYGAAVAVGGSDEPGEERGCG